MIIFMGALVILITLIFCISTRRLPRFYWWLMLLGWAIGMIWEVGFTFSEMGYPIHPGGAPFPEQADLSDLPTPAILAILVVVSIWDAALFLLGLIMARLVLGPQIERLFSFPALLIMLAWGQLQSLLIETCAIDAGMWAYQPSPLNPELFGWNQAQITALPQLVWFAGYLAYYAGVLAISRRVSAPEPQAAA